MNRDIDSLIASLTLEEKASLCSGRDFWNTKPIGRLGIPAIMMTDGPHGVRKQKGADDVGLIKSEPATCFPTGAGLAASWSREAAREVGAAIAEEALALGVSIVLGPAINIKRSPLCGRNFEYFSEDPLLAGELAAEWIRGAQEKGVGASLKHFAANNQEKGRMFIDTIVDERTLREIYLRGFEIAVKKSQPWTVMCAYPRLNGTFCSENPWLLTEVLKREWGHEGIVVTDWGACNDRAAGLAAGQELEMPGNGGITDADIVAAVKSGALKESVLDASLRRLLRIIFMAADARKPGHLADLDTHQALARRIAGECIVLLQNENDILPLDRKGKIAFIGGFAQAPRYEGGGSSLVNATRVETAYQESLACVRNSATIKYAPGYPEKGDAVDDGLLEEARRLARWADVAVVFVGLPDAFESEGFDRKSMRMPKSHDALVEAVCGAQKRTVVVLCNGSPVEMPWAGSPKAILEAYLGGQAGGGAMADVLFGAVNPSGKLAETFPVLHGDTPAIINFPGDRKKVEYREGIFVGYRYYDAAEKEPLFPFGHGLSYTRFDYSGISADRTECLDTEGLTVKVDVRNAGKRAGNEVVQLYVRDVHASVIRPPKELAGFQKIGLEPGEKKSLSFTLDSRAFAFWDQDSHAWRVEDGEFEILVGSSSRDIRQRVTVKVRAAALVRPAYDQTTPISHIRENPTCARFVQAIEKGFMSRFAAADPDSAEALMWKAMTEEMPLRNLSRMGGALTPRQLKDLVAALNGAPVTPELEKLL